MNAGRTWAEISISALLHNLSVIKKEAGSTPVMAVVKADAYGHGTEYIVPALDKAGVDTFAVSNIDEALDLRNLGVKKPILVLGYTSPLLAKQLALNNIIQTVYCMDYAKQLSEKALLDGVKVNAHLKFDTGMGRLVFVCRENIENGVAEALSVSRLDGLDITGAFTHLAVADETDKESVDFTKLQLNRFNVAVTMLKDKGVNLKAIHCFNSAGILYNQVDFKTDYVRAGIVLYGLLPDGNDEKNKDLRPVMTLKSVVSMVKTLKKGECVSYGRTFTAENDIKIATVTVGYADGYPRLLSNKGYVLIDGKKAPVVGRVCMDQMLVDISGIENVNIGDEVVLFGDKLSVSSLAKLIGTINYEVICGISKRVPRIAVE